MALRFHAETGGSTLTAQQPENNVVRVAIEALSAACGGASGCTRTASTKRSRYRPSGRHGSRSARSRSSSTRRGRRRRSTRRRKLLHRVATTEIEERSLELIDRIEGRARGHRRRAGLRPTRDRGGRRPLLAADRVRGALIVGVNVFTERTARRSNSTASTRRPAPPAQRLARVRPSATPQRPKRPSRSFSRSNYGVCVYSSLSVPKV